MNKLWMRLAVSFLAITLAVIALVAVLVRGSIESSFGDYVNASNAARFGGDLMSALEDYYRQNATWQGIETLLPGHGGGQGTGSGQNSGTRGAQVFIADNTGVIVASTQADWLGQPADDIGATRRVALTVDGRTVGTLGEQTPGALALNEAEQRFLADISGGLTLTELGAGVVALVLGIVFSYNLTRPLHQLTERISRWKLRDAPAPLEVRGTDEIRRLGAAFNDLLARLAEGEALRQRMSADVAHELRTPVTVMRGHLEAMMDGVYPLDTAHLAVAYDQVLHLARLVEDLRLLTQAEAGKLPLTPHTFDVIPLIHAAVERFAPLTQDRALQVETHFPPTPAPVHADPHRLQQVLDNLLSNAVRHPPTGGRIGVSVTHEGDAVTVRISNQSETPLTDAQVAHLFDRFWRGEDARARDSGGSGLGLAITRELLRVMGGDIHAQRTPDGLIMTFRLGKENTDATKNRTP